MTEPSNGKLQDVTRRTPDVNHWPPVESLFTELQMNVNWRNCSCIRWHNWTVYFYSRSYASTVMASVDVSFHLIYLPACLYCDKITQAMITMSLQTDRYPQDFSFSQTMFIQKLRAKVLNKRVSRKWPYLQGGPKKVSLVIFAITLSTASQFS